MKKKEIIKDLTKDVIRASAIRELKLRGIFCWPQNRIPLRGRKFIGLVGLSDIIGFVERSGVFVACEVKTRNDRFSVEQKHFLTSLRLAGGIALVARQSATGHMEIVEFEL